MIRALITINSLVAAGAETLILQLCRHLPREGVEPIVASLLGPGPLTPLFEESGIRVVNLSEAGERLGLKSFWRLMWTVRRERIDIVHTHLVYAGIMGKVAAALTGLPVVTTRHYTTDLKITTPFYRLEDRLTKTGTARVVAISDYMRRFILDSGLAEPRRVVVHRNAIDVDRFRTLVTESERPGNLIIGTAGRMEPQKAQEVFLEAMAIIRRNIPTVRGVLVGEGSKRSELEAARARLCLDDVVSFVGTVSPEEMPTLLSTFDVFVLSSDWEGLPIVLIEAAALGIPVVATDVNAVSEVVKDGRTGLLVPPRNPRAIAEAAVAILGDPDRRRRFGRKAREYADAELDIKRLARQTATLYRDVLAERGSP